MVPDWKTNTVLISDVLSSRHPEIAHHLEVLLQKHGIPLKIIPDMADLWIRDAAPVQLVENRFLQFRYQPGYLQGYEHLITKPEVFRKVGFFAAPEQSEIILDGGNLVGTRSVVLVTEKIYRENPDWNRNDLRNELRRLLKAERLIVIPKEPYDVIGHSDAMARFLSETQVVVNDYRTIDPKFGDRLESLLKKQGLQIIRLPYVPEKQTRNGIPSAVGNYVNFLRVGEIIIVPAYGLPEDEIALTVLRNQVSAGHIVSLPCRGLAEEGGALNCATWTGSIPLPQCDDSHQ